MKIERLTVEIEAHEDPEWAAKTLSLLGALPAPESDRDGQLYPPLRPQNPGPGSVPDIQIPLSPGCVTGIIFFQPVAIYILFVSIRDTFFSPGSLFYFP